MEETVGKNGSVVTDYAYELNIHSDSQFLKEHLEQMDVQEKNVTVVVDGAYSGTENTVLAKEKNVNLITTSLTGWEAPDISLKVVRIWYQANSVRYFSKENNVQGVHTGINAVLKYLKGWQRLLHQRQRMTEPLSSEPCTTKNSKTMHDCEMELKLFRPSFGIIIVLIKCHEENKEEIFQGIIDKSGCRDIMF